MQVDHGGGQVPVAHEHLDSADIVTGLQQMGGKAVAEGMDAGTFPDSGFFSSLLIDAAHRCVGEGLVLFALKGGGEQVALGLAFFEVLAQLLKKP